MHSVQKMLQVLHPTIVLLLVHIIYAKYVKYSVLYSKVPKDIMFWLLFKWRTSRWLKKKSWISWKRLILYACLIWQNTNFPFLDKIIVSILIFLWNWSRKLIEENFLKKDRFWKLLVPRCHFADTSPTLCCGLSCYQEDPAHHKRYSLAVEYWQQGRLKTRVTKTILPKIPQTAMVI